MIGCLTETTTCVVAKPLSTKYDIKKCSNFLFKNVGNSLRGVEGHSHFQKPLKLSGKAASKHISYQETCNLF